MSVMQSWQQWRAAGNGSISYDRINSKGKILFVLHFLKALYLGCFRGYFDKILHKHCMMMEV